MIEEEKEEEEEWKSVAGLLHRHHPYSLAPLKPLHLPEGEAWLWQRDKHTTSHGAAPPGGAQLPAPEGGTLVLGGHSTVRTSLRAVPHAAPEGTRGALHPLPHPLPSPPLPCPAAKSIHHALLRQDEAFLDSLQQPPPPYPPQASSCGSRPLRGVARSTAPLRRPLHPAPHGMNIASHPSSPAPLCPSFGEGIPLWCAAVGCEGPAGALPPTCPLPRPAPGVHSAAWGPLSQSKASRPPPPPLDQPTTRPYMTQCYTPHAINYPRNTPMPCHTDCTQHLHCTTAKHYCNSSTCTSHSQHNKPTATQQHTGAQVECTGVCSGPGVALFVVPEFPRFERGARVRLVEVRYFVRHTEGPGSRGLCRVPGAACWAKADWPVLSAESPSRPSPPPARHLYAKYKCSRNAAAATAATAVVWVAESEQKCSSCVTLNEGHSGQPAADAADVAAAAGWDGTRGPRRGGWRERGPGPCRAWRGRCLGHLVWQTGPGTDSLHHGVLRHSLSRPDLTNAPASGGSGGRMRRGAARRRPQLSLVNFSGHYIAPACGRTLSVGGQAAAPAHCQREERERRPHSLPLPHPHSRTHSNTSRSYLLSHQVPRGSLTRGHEAVKN
ncbi:hypothetical protein O3P69_009564 [Scylla paramamosain]|uniref:Uncharacterized protein n=1 Tax=Scylla paramamosain TaxID=85552 RepID=A0AAW0SU92_SCYPA